MTTVTNAAVKIHTKKSAIWLNAAGDMVPLKFVPDVDKSREILAAGVHKEAIKVEQALRTLHNFMNEATRKVQDYIKKEYALKEKNLQTKGNITWYNFDKSIKIEADVQDIVRWDDAVMTEALALLNKYLNSNLSDANMLIKGLVNDAFANTKGSIDTRKVMQLLKYEGKIKDRDFQKACVLMRQASAIDRKKLYMRVWEKMENGEYRNINLNFSSL